MLPSNKLLIHARHHMIFDMITELHYFGIVLINLNKKKSCRSKMNSESDDETFYYLFDSRESFDVENN